MGRRMSRDTSVYLLNKNLLSCITESESAQKKISPNLGKNNMKTSDEIIPFHFLCGSIARAFKTIDKLANPQYAGSDCVWK